jgi:hypothetical protein
LSKSKIKVKSEVKLHHQLQGVQPTPPHADNLPPRVATAWAGWVAVATTTAISWSAAISWGTTVGWSWGRVTTAVGWAWCATKATTEPWSTTWSTKLTEIAVGTTTTGTAATATATATTETGRLASNVLEEGWDLLVGLLQQINELTDDTAVATVEEGSGDTSVTSTASTTDTMNVVIDISWEIVVDDVGDVWNIETTSGDGSGDQDWAAAVTEHLKGTLTLTLSAVTMDGGGWEVLVDQEVGQRISHALGLDEDEGKTSTVGVENIQENGALVHVLDVLDLLGDVLRGGTDTTDGQEDIILQEVASEHLNVAWEGGREHESLAVLDTWHVLTLDDAADLWLETHVQHTISLIENEVLDILERDAATLDEINETTWSGNQEIAATLNLAELGTDIGTTVDDTGADPRSVGKLAGLVVDLRDELTGWGKDQRGWVRLALTAKVSSGVGWSCGRAVDESLGQDWEEETTSLSGTGLGTSHQVTATHDDWDGVLLDWSWDLVVSKLDVADEMVVKRWVGELGDWLWDVVSGGLNWDIVVLLKVDTGLLLGWVIKDTEELTLDTWVGWASNVLAVAPLSVTAATSDAASVADKGLTFTAATVGAVVVVRPSAAAWSTAATSWSKGWSSAPVTAWSWTVSMEAVWWSWTVWSPG